MAQTDYWGKFTAWIKGIFRCLAAIYKDIIVFFRRQLEINPIMARHGGLLFSFGLIVLAVQPSNKAPILFPDIPAPPEFLCPVAIACLFLLSILAIFVIGKYMRGQSLRRRTTFFLWLLIAILSLLLLLLMIWLMRLVPVLHVEFYFVLGLITLAISAFFMISIFWKWLATKLENIKARFEATYWMLVYIVYSIGWMKGLTSFPGDELNFHMVFWFGFPWFLIFTFLLLRASLQTGRHLYNTENNIASH